MGSLDESRHDDNFEESQCLRPGSSRAQDNVVMVLVRNSTQLPQCKGHAQDLRERREQTTFHVSFCFELNYWPTPDTRLLPCTLIRGTTALARSVPRASRKQPHFPVPACSCTLAKQVQFRQPTGLPSGRRDSAESPECLETQPQASVNI